ncbi:site-specific DNA-methyltransferase [Xanthomonas phaseoli]|uniref:site-specific DNA-methyltransferase n=1 Tax=Xanthomonas phaseoli TaxID=1985254 RepID=UPI0004741AAD|nr:DNA methyltransferase [Xanthomonas phaseoli]
MSRLTDLIAQAKSIDPKLGADLDREFKVLSARLPFGLNFERHSPEAVELPQRPIRKGDKVRVLPERGSTKKGDQRLWQVKVIHKANQIADLELPGATTAEMQSVALDDLVVVAEFRDTIYPGLVSTGKVQRGGEKPFHTVINGENYHVLKALTFTHRGKVDAIYIDPPYNTGAKDWKYNNDYVEKDDLYRHSKWLAFIERRLQIARELLNPTDSVLIVTIDEKEYLRLGLLLDQVFPEARIQMVSITTNPKGASRPDMFARVDEFAYFVLLGDSTVSGIAVSDSEGQPVRWPYLRRSDEQSTRGHRPRQFYPVFVDPTTSKITGVGEPLPHDVSRESFLSPPGVVAVFPVRDDGVEMEWGLTGASLMRAVRGGFARASRVNSIQPYAISYMTAPAISKVESGEYTVSGIREDGTKLVIAHGGRTTRPTTVWVESRHSAPDHGKKIVGALLPTRPFPFPKSLYVVEDSLRLFVENKPNAVVLDFFSGSGTTAHAVMRLNKQDGGRRQCISVTNNEVAADEQKALREQGLRPGDPEWEQWGICDYITKPRVEAAITGKTPDGEPIRGDYKFTDEFPMAEGFEENAEFFTLTYETPVSVSHNLAFARIAPLLWLRAGACGKRINKLPTDGWAVADAYGLLTEVDMATPFIKAVKKIDGLRIAYIVTDDDRRFQAIAKRLPDGVEPVRLYESYLTNFSFANGE